MSTARETQIGRLKVQGADMDTPTLRLAVSGFVGQADLQPQGLPASAVLIIRKLRDPMPGRIPNTLGHRLHHSGWEQVVRDQLADITRTAVRPDKGVVHDHGEAVLFTDQAEMLACLALDLINSSAGQHWWWQTLLRYPESDLSPVHRLVTLWQQDINLLPSSLESLHTWGRAEEVLNKLNAAETRGLSLAMSKAFDISALSATLETLPLPRDDDLLHLSHSAEKDEGLSSEAPIRSIDNHTYTYSIVPANRVAVIWQKLLPGTRLPLQLDREITYLLALGLALQHVPWRCRNSAVQTDLALAWRGVELVPVQAVTATSAHADQLEYGLADPGKNDPAILMSVRTKLKSAATDIAAKPFANGKRSSKDIETQATVAKSAKCNTISEQSVSSSTQVTPDLSTNQSSQDNLSTRLVSTDDQHQAKVVNNAEELQSGLSEEGITTDLGGVLYLINLIQRLELPACFEDSWQLQSQLSPWALLELLARSLLTQSEYNFCDDPLWTVLAQLDGREVGDPVGTGFIGPDIYHIPSTWLQQIDFQDYDIAYAYKNNQLRVWSAAGFLIAAQPGYADQTARQQAMSLINSIDIFTSVSLKRRGFTHAPLFDIDELSIEVASSALKHWLRYTIPYMSLILAQQTSIQDGRFDISLLQCRGRLFVTNTHIDFCTALDNIALPMRRASLDRDPGWVSEFGRVVLFHFD